MRIKKDSRSIPMVFESIADKETSTLLLWKLLEPSYRPRHLPSHRDSKYIFLLCPAQAVIVASSLLGTSILTAHEIGVSKTDYFCWHKHNEAPNKAGYTVVICILY